MEQKNSNQMSGEPKHAPCHNTVVLMENENTYTCPDCGETFTFKKEAEKHLHSQHLEHLHKMHKEFHGEDVEGYHVG